MLKFEQHKRSDSNLEGVLKALGTAGEASWVGFTLDLSDAVENMAAKSEAGVRTSLET